MLNQAISDDLNVIMVKPGFPQFLGVTIFIRSFSVVFALISTNFNHVKVGKNRVYVENVTNEMGSTLKKCQITGYDAIQMF